MHAFLIVGNNNKMIEKEIARRISEWKISPWDVTCIPAEGTVGIEVIRDFEREISLSPRNSPSKVGVLTDMERLTVEAQNALLKTLEEPPPHTYIIGTTGMPEALLPTILSRMSIVKLAEGKEKIDASLLADLLASPVGKRLQLLDTYTGSRDEAKQFVTTLIAAAHQEMLAHPSPRLTVLLRNLLAAESQLSVNVNQRLVVDNALVNISDTESV